MEKLKNKHIVFVSLLFYVVVAVVNFMGARGIINNMSQKAVSASFPTMITPAGYAFLIWAVIYVLMFAALMVLMFKSEEDYNSKVIRRTSILFWISSVLNVLWTVAFSYKQIWLAMILIVSLFLVLLSVLKKLSGTQTEYRGLFDIAIGLYTGWLFVASVVNIAAFLVSVNFNFFGKPVLIYSVMLIVTIIIGLLLNKVHNNPVFYLANSWAFVAIIVANKFKSSTNPMFLILGVGAILSLFIAFEGFKKIKYKLF